METVFLPDFSGGNPYQRNLADALEEFNVSVTMGKEGGMFPILDSVQPGDRVSIAHFHWFQPYISGPGLLVTLVKTVLTIVQLGYLRIRGITCVWTAHNLISHDSEYPWLERHFKRWMIRLTFINHVFVHCDTASDQLLDELNLPRRYAERTTVVNHGHFINNYPNSVSPDLARKCLDLDEPGITYLYFGNIRPYKGLFELVDAFQLNSNQADRLVLVGSPDNSSMVSELNDQITDNDQIRTYFGYIPNDLVQLFMNTADVVVLPYRNITTSGSAILAMSFGKPMILPSIGCIPEIVNEDGAILYDPNVEGVGGAMARVAQTDLDKMGTINLETAKSLSWSATASKTIEVYEEILNAHDYPR